MRSSSRSRSREREVDQSSFQLRSHTRANAVLHVAYANHPRSISRLHDDELSCVLAFLSLSDLALLVRCSRRFNAVARKERDRGLRLEGDASIAPLVSSSLRHHVSSIRVHRRQSNEFVTLHTLRLLKDCPQLTALQLSLCTVEDAAALLEGQSAKQAVEALKAMLPTRLTTFDAFFSDAADSTGELCSAFCAALTAMPQLTNLFIYQSSRTMDLPPGMLTQLPRLRKLRLWRIHWTSKRLSELKQLSELRELSLFYLKPAELIELCEPPHFLQLATIALDGMRFDEVVMRALFHLPTLTALEHGDLQADGWPLLPQLPLLQRLMVWPKESLTAELTSSLSASLSQLPLLTDVSLLPLDFGATATPQQEQARLAEILRSLPHVRHLVVWQESLVPFLAALTGLVPQLDHLELHWGNDTLVEDILPQLAHPFVRELHLNDLEQTRSKEQLTKAWAHSASLPRLERIRYVW
jgi:hypothetical protein